MHYFAKGIVFLMVITLSVLANAFSYPVGTSVPRNGTGYENKQIFGVWNGDWDGFHLGEDWNRGSYNDDCGDSIYAVAGGIVKEARYFNYQWGRIIIIDHGLVGNERVESFYGHVNLTEGLSKGDVVTWGQKIAEIGGNFNGMFCHLHFKIRNEDCDDFGDDGYGYLDPMPEVPEDGWLHPSDFIDARPISVTTFWSNTTSSMGPWELTNNQYFHVKARIANGSSSNGIYLYRVVLSVHDDNNNWVSDIYTATPYMTLMPGATYLIDSILPMLNTATLVDGDYQIVVKYQSTQNGSWKNVGSRDFIVLPQC